MNISISHRRIFHLTILAVVVSLLVSPYADAAPLATSGAAAAMNFQVPLPRPEGPCDIYAAAGNPCAAAHSTTRALYASYNGPLYQVLRQSDGATLDIGVVQPTALDAGGYADAAAQDAFCADTYCWITKLYDQSGHGNDLTQAPRGGFSGPAMGGFNNVPIADMAPVTVMGHKAYGIFIEPGMGLRQNDVHGTAVDDQAEGQYWVINGWHYNSGCCYDYGNAEIDSRDDGNGTMETTYYGNATSWYHGPGAGPWIMTDQENNLVGCVNPGSSSKLCADLPIITWRFVTATADGEPHHWRSMGGDAQQGPMTIMFDGPRVDSSYDPMRKQGAILLGNGGDNSVGSQGTFYEGAMTAAGTFPTEATNQLIQANIVAAKYDVQRVSLTPASNLEAVTFPRVAGKFGNAVKLNGTDQSIQLLAGVVSSLTDFTISTWVNPQSIDTWARVFDFGSSTDVNMFLTVSAGSTPRFAITISGNSSTAEQRLNASSALALNQWTLLTVTHEGNVGRLYVNGNLVDTNTAMTLSPSSMGATTGNWIGKSTYASDPLFNGLVDEFQIYNRALSAAEVQSLLDSAGGSAGGGNHLWYRFDEESGEAVLDSSGNGRDGMVITPSAVDTPPGLQTFAPGSSQGSTVTFVNTTGAPATGVKLSIIVPAGWTSFVPGTTNTSVTFAGPVAPGASVSAAFKVTSGPAPFNGDLLGKAEWTNPATGETRSETMAEKVRNVSPIKINEFRIQSSGNTTNSFIELYNAGASAVDLSGWTLTEHPTQQAIFSTVTVPAGTTLPAHGLYLLGLSTSGLAAPASAGDTNIKVRSTTGLAAGRTIDIDGETRTISSVGTAATAATTLWQPLPEGPVMTIPAGSTNVPVTSVSGFSVGQKIALGYGATYPTVSGAIEQYEVATVTAVGVAGTQGYLSARALAGATNIKVTTVTNIRAGDQIRLDIDSVGHGVETVTVTTVGTSGANGTGLTLAAPLQYTHASNLPFSDRGTGISFTPATAFPHSSNEPVQALGTGITLSSALANNHVVNAPVRDPLVTNAGYQASPAPNQWFGGPALSTSAGAIILRDAAGRVSDSLNYGLLVDPWAAEGYQATSPGSGCRVSVPASARSQGRYPDGKDTDSNCTDFVTTYGTSTAPTPGQPNAPAVTGITLDTTALSIVETLTRQLVATITPSNAYNKNVSWTTSDPAVATVSASGLVTAVAPGTATITVTTEDGGFTADCVVTVTMRIPATGVTLDKSTLTLQGTTGQLTATVAPADASNKNVTFASSNTSVATVSAVVFDAGTGTSSVTVSPAGIGTAVVTATTVDGGFTASADVTVLNAAPVVNAGTGGTAVGPYVTLNGTATDDGLPTGTLSPTWSLVSGPGTATFANPNALSTNVAVSTAGTYVFLLTVSDGDLSSSATVTMNVLPAPNGGGNVVWYKFNEASGATALDSSGNGKNGTITGATGARTTGVFGNALRLSGSTQYVSLPTGIVSNLNDFTIAGWVNPAAISTWARIFDFGTGTNVYMFLAASAGSTPRFAITTSGNGAEQQLNAPSALPTNTWTHFAITLQGNTGRLYINGVQVSSNNSMTLHPSSLGNTNQNWIGRSQFSSDPYLNGTVDDFQIYNYALTAAQVKTLTVRTIPAVPISTYRRIAPVLPATVTVNYHNNTSGQEAVTWDAVDPASYANPGSFSVNGTVAGTTVPATANVTVTNFAPSVSSDPVSQDVQYSDLVTPVAISVKDTAVDLPLSASTQWALNGGAFQSGLPDWLELTAAECTVDGIWATCPWTLEGTGPVAVAVPAGTYVVRLTVGDGLATTDSDITLVVKPEDARVTYNGNGLFWTSSVNSTSANVTLSAAILDATADPALDPYAGDIRNAKVTFINRDTNTAFAGCTDLSVGLVNPADLKTGIATCNTTLSTGTGSNSSGAQFTIGIVVSGYYARNSSEDDTLITVAQPIPSNFITGGGHLVLSNSAGQVPGTAGSKTNFGFNVKYTKSGTNLQGNVNLIVRSGGHVYKIKATAISSLGVTDNTANFSGKANIMDVTDPLNLISLEGNATLQLWMTDNGDEGTSDTLGIQVLSKNGGMWFSSNWSGTKTVEQALGGGNLSVH